MFFLYHKIIEIWIHTVITMTYLMESNMSLFIFVSIVRKLIVSFLIISWFLNNVQSILTVAWDNLFNGLKCYPSSRANTTRYDFRLYNKNKNCCDLSWLPLSIFRKINRISLMVIYVFVFEALDAKKTFLNKLYCKMLHKFIIL